jgi:hypothetical protein
MTNDEIRKKSEIRNPKKAAAVPLDWSFVIRGFFFICNSSFVILLKRFGFYEIR